MLCDCCGAKMNIIQVQIIETEPDSKGAPMNTEDPLGINHLLTM